MKITLINTIHNMIQTKNHQNISTFFASETASGLKMKAPLLMDEVSFEGKEKDKDKAKKAKGKGKSQSKKKTTGKKAGDKQASQKKGTEKKKPASWEEELDKMLKEAAEECEREGRHDPDTIPDEPDEDYETNMEKAIRLYGTRN